MSNENKRRSWCDEQGEVSRRQFLSASSLAAGATFSAPAWAPRVVFGGTGGPPRDVLVQVFLDGAMDGLSLVPPHQDGDYYAARPVLAIPPPGQANGAIDLDGFFGLNPNAQRMMTPYSNGHLAFVQASGLTDPTRSHFDGRTLMEAGLSDVTPSAEAGWIGKHMRGVAPLSVVRGVSLGHFLPLSLRGVYGTLPIKDGSGFRFPGRPVTASARTQLLNNLFMDAAEPFRSTAIATVEAIDALEGLDLDSYASAGAVPYPPHAFGQQLRVAAALIDADIGVEALTMDLEAWDDHIAQGPLFGRFGTRVSRMARSLEAFYLDLLTRGHLDRVTTVLMSEFGRKVEENSSLGTDHGHGNTMMVMGGHIAGGQVFANWPGLDAASLDDGDLTITTDYRDVLGEIALQRLATTNIDEVFPGHTVAPIGITI